MVYIVAPAGQVIFFEDLVDLVPDKDVSTLCSALCRPADGMINDATGNPIHNPGIPVSALAEIPLKIAIYLARLFSCRINRTLTPAMITVAEIRVAQTIMERNAVHKNSTKAAKIGDTKAMMELLEDPGSHLSNYTSEDHVPLPYAYRPMVPPLPKALDPCGGYNSVEENMIVARAPHTLPAYYVDNADLAKILQEMVSDFKVATAWAQDSFRNQDSRQIKLDWMLHFCGTALQKAVEITAKATMNITFYKGEKPRFTLVLYTNIHCGCHNEINLVCRLA